MIFLLVLLFKFSVRISILNICHAQQAVAVPPCALRSLLMQGDRSSRIAAVDSMLQLLYDATDIDRK